VTLRRGILRWVVRNAIRPGLAPQQPIVVRRARTERTARLLSSPPGVSRVPAGVENPGGEWLLPSGVGPGHAGGALLYIHGGGFVLGSPATSRAIAGRLARLTGLPVLSASYRLAPEAPFPAALEDVQAAWRSITLGGDRPVALAGDSAGGWLALALALYAAAAGLPRPSGLALFSPLLDLAGAESCPALGDLMLPPGFVAEGVRAWRGDAPLSDPRFDLLGADLSTLSPLFVSFDRDEALAGDARRLIIAARSAGVTVRAEEAVGLWHAWPLLAGLLPEAGTTLRDAAAMLAPASRTAR
jgi:epsilon-lactone hydrolase